MNVYLAKTDADILKCREVMRELRPHVSEEEFLPRVKEMFTEGYQLAFIEENGQAVAAIGFRYENFLFCGKHFYIDDLTTMPSARGKGYGGVLLDFVAALAKEKGFKLITLDSGHHRHTAHRLYLNKGFVITSHHFVKKFDLQNEKN
ncbi:MAG TPA: GNAT family N-acetyltransferase [Bacteroidia bacterium]|jgi:GNAT superfamily N-acetyltransferase|nr:GNAT family N-acetyltransferase [Bacteroidia bacterium]